LVVLFPVEVGAAPTETDFVKGFGVLMGRSGFGGREGENAAGEACCCEGAFTIDSSAFFPTAERKIP
jgi:hypothetical protein